MCSDYSSGESGSEYVNEFAYLKTEEKTKRLLQLWQRCDVKLKGAIALTNKYRGLKEKVSVLGHFNGVVSHFNLEVEGDEVPTFRGLILPDEKRKKRWDLLVGILLILTAIYLPIRTAFVDNNTWALVVCETLVDAFFITDIVLTFFAAYEEKHRIETRPH